MSRLQCPYCDENLGYADDCHDPSDTYEYHCHKCDNYFTFTLDYEVHYYEKQAPCLNGGEHEWEDVIGAPTELFEGVKRCKHCNKQNKELNYKKAFGDL